MPDRKPSPAAAPRARCPICARPTDPRYRPFCSRRCADIDLGKWLSGGYALPSEETPDEDEMIRALSDPKNP